MATSKTSKKPSKQHPKRIRASKKPELIQNQVSAVKLTTLQASANADSSHKKLPNVLLLTQQAALTLWRNWRLFVGITVIYSVLTLILVQGLSSGTSATSLKQALQQFSHGQTNALASSLGVFVLLVGNSTGGSGSDAAGVYQLLLILITSLAVIWALRQVLAGEIVRIRDTFYRGMYPLIPFFLVLLVIGLQLVPLVIGGTIYTTVVSNGLATNGVEQLIWIVIFGGLAAVSLYLVSGSLFALYIVTLPDMTPVKALRSARQLVRKRRLLILRKVLFLPVVLLVVAIVIMLPVIWIITAAAQWIFFVLTMFAVVAAHSYLYTLYRELLHE